MSALPPRLGKPAPSTSRVKVPRRNHIPASQLPILHHFVNGNATQHFGRTFFSPTQVPNPLSVEEKNALAPARQPIAVTAAETTKKQKPPPTASEPGRITAVSELPICLMKERELPEKWPHRCYWDHHEFDTPPVGLPMHYDPIHIVYRMFGVFCCYNCAAAFSAESVSYSVNQRARLLLTQLMRQLAKAEGREIAVDDISCRPSPHWSALKAYGGPLEITDFRRLIKNRRLGLHIYPPWLRIIPVGYLMYAEDRTQPLPGEFSANYKVVAEEHGKPSGQREPSDAQRPRQQQRRAATAAAAATATATATEFSAPAVHGQMVAQWNWKAMQTRTDRQIEEEGEHAQTEQKQLPLAFRRNILTGRREAASQPTAAEIDRKAASLRANALPSLRVDPRQPNIAMQLSRGICSVPMKPSKLTAPLKKRPLVQPSARQFPTSLADTPTEQSPVKRMKK